MKSNVRNLIALILIMGGSIGFVIGGSYLIYWQRMGIKAIAVVTDCRQSRRSEVCNGAWMVDGKVITGILENVSTADMGKKIEVRLMGERAIKPGLRLPILLYGLGVTIALLGWRWWKKEALR